MSSTRRNALVLAVLGGLLGLAWLALDPDDRPLTAAAPDAPTPPSHRTRVATAPSPVDDPDAAPTAEAAPAEDPDAALQAALEARQEELLADPRVQVLCDVDPPLPAAAGYLAIDGHSDGNGRVVEVVLGRAYLPLVQLDGQEPRPRYTGWLSIDGYAPTQVAFTGPSDDGPGACDDEPIALTSGDTVVTGTVTHEGSGEPAKKAWVEGCGSLARTDGDGHYYMEVVPEPCTLTAMRQDGMLRTLSETVEVHPKPGHDAIVDFAIPGWPRAGMGATIALDERGFRIQDVIAGGGAEAAGLTAGDLVVEVDGTPAVDMELGEFVDAVGGQAGTEVTLVVATPDGEREVTVVRKELG